MFERVFWFLPRIIKFFFIFMIPNVAKLVIYNWNSTYQMLHFWVWQAWQTEDRVKAALARQHVLREKQDVVSRIIDDQLAEAESYMARKAKEATHPQAEGAVGINEALGKRK